ncbi:MAG: VTT domain-containing protein [Gammaproteobacteria bacterium]|nr:VTT domain-containing protein [Gammaproteobacteria bacterium]
MKNTTIKLILALILLTGIAIVVMYRDQLNAEALEQWIQNAGGAAPILFMVIYALGAVLFLPGSLLTLLGGALFGPYWGTFYNLTAATVGAMLSFLVARYLAADWVAKKMDAQTGGKMKQLVSGVENEGWRFVAFTRLVPLFPFNLLNYALGLTRISFTQYSIATYVCMLPGAVAYTYLGYAGKEAIAGGEGMIQKILLAIALLAVVGFLPRLIGMLRRKPMVSTEQLKQRLDAGEKLLLLDVRPEDGYHGDLGHIPQATHIPLNELPQRLDELGDYLEQPVLTICRTDKMSSQAAQLLAQHGFADVQVVKMGMVDWNKQGYPVNQ